MNDLELGGPYHRNSAESDYKASARSSRARIIGIFGAQGTGEVGITPDIKAEVVAVGFDEHALIPSAQEIPTNAFDGVGVGNSGIVGEAGTAMIGVSKFTAGIVSQIKELAKHAAIVPRTCKGWAVFARAEVTICWG